MSFSIVQTNISAGTRSAQSLITPTRRQLAQIALIDSYAKSNELEFLALSIDKQLSGFVIDAGRVYAVELAAKDYATTKNPTNMARKVNGLLGLSGIPSIPTKSTELSLYPHTLASWVRTNGKTERTEKTQTLYAAKVAFLAPVLAAINSVLTLENKQVEKIVA